MKMKSRLILLFLFCQLVTTSSSQSLLNDFGYNRITTSSIVFTTDGKQIVVGGYARTYKVADGQFDLRTAEKEATLIFQLTP
jgi:hypothetical protein